MKKQFLLSFLISILLVCSLITLVYAAIFSDGFESGDFTAWTGTQTNGGTLEVQNVIKNSGTYAEHVQIASGGFYGRAYQNLTAANTYYVRMYFRIHETIPTAYLDDIMFIMNTAGDVGIHIRVSYNSTNADNEFYLHNDWGNDQWGSVVANDTWYCIEVKASNAAASQWWINGNAQPNSAQLGSQMDRLRVGATNIATGITINTYFDDVVVDSSYIGPISGGAAHSFVSAENLLIAGAAYKSMALRFQVTDILRLWASGTAAFQLSIPQWFNFTLGVLLKLYDAATPNKALLFQNAGILRVWDSATMNKAVWIGVFQIFEAVRLYADSIVTLPQIATSIGSAFALAALALIIALSGFGAIFLLRRH